jgi:hypothetical protein
VCAATEALESIGCGYMIHAMCWVAAPCPQAARTLFARYANLTKEKLKSNVRGCKKLNNILQTV